LKRVGERTRVWAEIDLGAATRNFRAIRARADGRRVIAVIKANAYGHGAILFARALADERCDAFAVISVEEAAELRAAGVRAPILILGGPMTPDDADRALALDASLVVSRSEALDWLEAAAERAGKTADFQLELDTGMGRLGLAPDELGALLARVRGAKRLRLDGVMSHLACADDAARPELDAILATDPGGRTQPLLAAYRCVALRVALPGIATGTSIFQFGKCYCRERSP
jgi:alanine racemase